MSDDTRRQIAAVQVDIAKVAAVRPAAVIIAAIDVLIEVAAATAAGDFIELREYMKLQLYRGIKSTLANRGSCEPPRHQT